MGLPVAVVATSAVVEWKGVEQYDKGECRGGAEEETVGGQVHEFALPR